MTGLDRSEVRGLMSHSVFVQDLGWQPNGSTPEVVQLYVMSLSTAMRVATEREETSSFRKIADTCV